MSAKPNSKSLLERGLKGLVAAMLPPEAGGPDPSEVARATRALAERMPPGTPAALGAAATLTELVALARTGRPLRRLDPERRSEVLASIARSSALGDVGVEALKTVVLLAHGAERHRDEAHRRANRFEPARDDPEIVEVAGADAPAEMSCDAVVVGSGAGGAMAARELARAGLEVVVVEEGRRWRVDEFRSRPPLERFAGLYRDAGATFALGRPPIALPRGVAVGGTTVVNSGTCFRPPERVVERWTQVDGLSLAEPAGLEERLADVERTIGVAPQPLDVLGRNGELMLEGAERLGWEAFPLGRNAPGCRGSCQCAIGCPRNAKAGVHMNALPEATAAGARVLSELTATRIVTRDGRAVGVDCLDAKGRGVSVRAPRVVSACGAIETPALLRRSGLGDHRQVGRNLAMHPALGVAGWFDEPVVAWRGVLQSVGTERLHAEHGVMIEATSTPPGMGSMIFPGVGAELVEGIETAEHVASLGAMIADEGRGRVHGARRPLVTYDINGAEDERLRLALRAQAEILIEAGARRLELGGGAPQATSRAELDRALAAVDPRRLHLAAFHPVGTVRAGGDAVRSPADPEGRLRGARGVWVADASILPSCPEVNPQVTIMALALGVGRACAAAAP